MMVVSHQNQGGKVWSNSWCYSTVLSTSFIKSSLLFSAVLGLFILDQDNSVIASPLVASNKISPYLHLYDRVDHSWSEIKSHIQMLLTPADSRFFPCMKATYQLSCHNNTLKGTKYPLLGEITCLEVCFYGIDTSIIRCPPIRAEYLDKSWPMRGLHSGPRSSGRL